MYCDNVTIYIQLFLKLVMNIVLLVTDYITEMASSPLIVLIP